MFKVVLDHFSTWVWTVGWEKLCRTALHRAAQRGYGEVIRLLIQAGMVWCMTLARTHRTKKSARASNGQEKKGYEKWINRLQLFVTTEACSAKRNQLFAKSRSNHVQNNHTGFEIFWNHSLPVSLGNALAKQASKYLLLLHSNWGIACCVGFSSVSNSNTQWKPRICKAGASVDIGDFEEF